MRRKRRCDKQGGSKTNVNSNKRRREMNHDITHCSGEGCYKRDTCHRYKAFKELDGYALFCHPCECIDRNYNLYWEDKQ